MGKRLGLGLAVVLFAACKKDEPPAPLADAAALPVAYSAAPRAATAADAGPPAPTDRTLRVVAETSRQGLVNAWPTSDGRWFVSSGPFVFEPKPDGELAVAGGAGAYAPLFGEDPDVFVGYLGDPPSARGVLADGASIDFFSDKRYRVGPAKVEALGGRSVRKATRFRDRVIGFADGGPILTWGDGDAKAALPLKGSTPDDLTTTSEGSLFVVAHQPKKSVALVYPKTPADRDEPRVIDLGDSLTSCAVMPAADAKTYVHCRRGKDQVFARLDGDHVTSVFEGLKDLGIVASIGGDGALYASAAKGFDVVRCAPGGTCEKLPRDAELRVSGEAVSYTRTVSDLSRDYGSESYWSGMSIMKETKSDPATSVRQIYARSASDVWVLAASVMTTEWGDSFETRMIAHSGPPRDRMHLPSPLDARVITRNASSPKAWIGHCSQVFVRLARAKATDAGPGTGTLETDALVKRLPDMRKIFAVSEDEYPVPFEWSLVTGKLGDDRVAGVFVTLSDGQAKMERLEGAVNKLADAFTPDPMSKPLVTCTPPVLTRSLGR